MRRLIFSFSALSLLAMAVGCTHTAGQCDCDKNGNCFGCLPHAVMPAAKAEPIKELPKDAPKETEQTSLETTEPPVSPSN
jgi:hypothetical protein